MSNIYNLLDHLEDQTVSLMTSDGKGSEEFLCSGRLSLLFPTMKQIFLH